MAINLNEFYGVYDLYWKGGCVFRESRHNVGGIGMQVVLCACKRKQATSSMFSRRLFRSALMQAIFVGAIFLFANRPCAGSIVVPDSIGLDASDLHFLFSSDTSSSSAPENTNDPEPGDKLQKSDPWDFLKALGSGGSSTSSSSSSSTGGTFGASCIIGVLNGTKFSGDDSDCGRIAEDRSLFLPDPPGTDLLRPPRAV